MDLLLSTDCPSFLLPALPFAFVSSSLNYIPSTLLRESAAPPSSHIVKRFYKLHVQQIKRRLDEVKELGAASADEWAKGLAAEGKERINDAIRWEQWEARGGLKKVNVRPQARAIATSNNTSSPQSLPKPHNNVQSHGSTPQHGQTNPKYEIPVTDGPMMHMSAQQYPQNHPRKSLLTVDQGDYSLMSPRQAPYHVPWINTGPFHQPSSHQVLPAPVPMPRPERTVKDANEAKAARRAEIERRCSLFDPPLLPHILNHMESFQAAIQISTPLTDAAWDVLKPRLLAQRANAEKRELELVQQNELLQSELKQRRHQDGQSKESKESVDRHWDSVQAPVRDRLGVLADAVINQRWASGRAVGKESCAKFAADVLLFVRRQFYDEIAYAKEAASASGQAVKSDPPNGPPTQTLTLENMKWVFDTKIKPITENFQRELFLCNGCDDNVKFYGFEGVIQHYAAKHTTALSKGSVVVFWRAEWPEEPPFNPEPSPSKSNHYQVPPPAAAGSNPWINTDQQLYHPNGGRYDSNVEGDPTQIIEGASTHPNAPYNSSQAMPYPSTSHITPYYPLYPPASASAPVAPPSGLPSGFANNYTNAYPQQWQGNTAVPGAVNGVGGQDMGQQYSGYGYPNNISPQGSTPGMPYGVPAAAQAVAPRPPHFDPSRNNAAQLTGEYQQQMNEMAKQAREVWYSTSNIKDLPASVRIYVVIHHMAARFAAKFSTVPSLAMFRDGLDNNAQMRPVRSLNGLACKTCVTGHSALSASHSQSQPPAGDRRLYTLPHLLNHFRTAHLEESQAFENPNSNPDGPKHDWTRDMIELPDTRLIADLVHCAGMDDAKLEMIAWAFPGVYPSPLPKLSALRNPAPVLNFREVLPIPTVKDNYSPSFTHPGPSIVSGSAKNRSDAASYNGPQNASRPLSQLSHMSEPPGEDEYDPHKPAYQDKAGVVGARIEGTEVRTGYMPDRVSDWHEPHSSRQPPETTDLSKLLYSATQSESGRGRPETSPAFVKCEQAETVSSARPYGERRTIQDDRYEHMQPTDIYASQPRGANLSPTDANNRMPGANARAAEKILQKLGQTFDTINSRSYEQNGQPSPVGLWTDRSRVKFAERERPYLADAVNHATRRTAQARPDISPISPMHSSRPESREARNTSPSYHQAPEVYQANFQRSTPNALISEGNIGTNGQASRAYLEYATPHRAVVEDRHLHNGYGIERPDSSRNIGRLIEASRHRNGPKSPVPVPVDSAYYRPRSPAEDVQAQSLYRVRSPELRGQDRMQRIVYEYPRQDRYEFVEEHGYAPSAQNRYSQRIEYVPVRMSDQSPPNSGRYIIAQPVDQRGRADYVPLAETYDQGAVFERDGQLYRAAPSAYQTPFPRGSAGSPPSYPY